MGTGEGGKKDGLTSQGRPRHGTEFSQSAWLTSELTEDSAAILERCDICHSITDRSVSLVRQPDSTRLPPASEALAGAGATGWGRVRRANDFVGTSASAQIQWELPLALGP
jgi:hypothetical protein